MERLFKELTSDEWAIMYEKNTNEVIVELTGWDMNNFIYSWFEEKIHQGEFESRKNNSVCMSITELDELWEKK